MVYMEVVMSKTVVRLLAVVPLMVLTLPILSLAQADPAGVVYLAVRDLPGKPDAEGKITQSAGKLGNHTGVTVRRTANGPGERHEALAHLLVVQSGEGTLVLGGELIGENPSAPNPDTRWSSIRNGVQKKLTAGVIVYIPSKTPHQYLVQAGKQLTYFTTTEKVP
jgi:hypothetical protein